MRCIQKVNPYFLIVTWGPWIAPTGHFGTQTLLPLTHKKPNVKIAVLREFIPATNLI